MKVEDQSQPTRETIALIGIPINNAFVDVANLLE